MAGGSVGSRPYLRSTELLSATASAWEAGQDLPDRGLTAPASVIWNKSFVILGKLHNTHNLNLQILFSLYWGEELGSRPQHQIKHETEKTSNKQI